MARAIQIGTGIVSIEMTRDIHDLVERVVRSIHGDTIEEIGTVLDELQAEAEEKWPAARGLDGKPRPRHGTHSRDQFNQRITVSADAITGVLSNSSPHAYKVRSGQIGENDATLQKIYQRRTTARGTLETIAGYRARIRNELPKKRHAWARIVVRPGRLKAEGLAEALSAALADAAKR